MTSHRPIARVSGEGFDADQVSLPCETCGLNELSCECEVESWPAPQLSEAEAAFRDARIREILEAKAERESLVEVEHLGPGRIAA